MRKYGLTQDLRSLLLAGFPWGIGGILCPKVERGEMVSLGEAQPEIFTFCYILTKLLDPF